MRPGNLVKITVCWQQAGDPPMHGLVLYELKNTIQPERRIFRVLVGEDKELFFINELEKL